MEVSLLKNRCRHKVCQEMPCYKVIDFRSLRDIYCRTYLSSRSSPDRVDRRVVMCIFFSVFRDDWCYKDRFGKRPVLLLPRKIKDKRLEIKIIGVFVCLCPRIAGESCKVKLFCNLKGNFRAYSEEL